MTAMSLRKVHGLKILIIFNYIFVFKFKKSFYFIIFYSFDTGEYYESVGSVFTRVPQA